MNTLKRLMMTCLLLSPIVVSCDENVIDVGDTPPIEVKTNDRTTNVYNLGFYSSIKDYTIRNASFYVYNDTFRFSLVSDTPLCPSVIDSINYCAYKVYADLDLVCIDGTLYKIKHNYLFSGNNYSLRHDTMLFPITDESLGLVPIGFGVSVGDFNEVNVEIP